MKTGKRTRRPGLIRTLRQIPDRERIEASCVFPAIGERERSGEKCEAKPLHVSRLRSG